jgi:hypothetical protein
MDEIIYWLKVHLLGFLILTPVDLPDGGRAGDLACEAWPGQLSGLRHLPAGIYYYFFFSL